MSVRGDRKRLRRRYTELWEDVELPKLLEGRET